MVITGLAVAWRVLNTQARGLTVRYNEVFGCLDTPFMLRKIWSLLERPAFYRLNQNTTGYFLRRAYRRLLNEHLELTGDESVLDLGCGPGEYCEFVRARQYIGIDLNEAYIRRAQADFGHLPAVRFMCMDVSALPGLGIVVDHAYCVALTHHLSDDEVIQTVNSSLRIVKGRVVVVDLFLPPVWRNPIGHFLVRIDRGRFGRTKEQLLALLGKSDGVTERVSSRFGMPCPAVAVSLVAARR